MTARLYPAELDAIMGVLLVAWVVTLVSLLGAGATRAVRAWWRTRR